MKKDVCIPFVEYKGQRPDYYLAAGDDRKERRYYQVPKDLYRNDSFIKAAINKSRIDDDSQMSKWLTTELTTLVAFSTRMDREMGMNLLTNNTGELYVSEEVVLGEEGAVVLGKVPFFDVPPGFRKIGHIHTHPGENVAGFSAGASITDWMFIMIEGEDNFLNIVSTSNGNIYIAYRESGVIEKIVDEFVAAKARDLSEASFQEKRSAYIDYLYGFGGILIDDNMATIEGDDNNKRIEVNIKMGEYLGYDLYQVNARNGKVQKLVRPNKDNQ